MKMTVGTKIASGFGVIIALILCMALNSLISLDNAKKDLVKINGANERMELADDVVIAYKNSVSGIRGYVAYGDEANYSKIEGDLNRVIDLQKELLELARTEKKADVQALIDETTKYKTRIVTEYLPVAKQYNTELSAGDFAKAQQSKGKLVELMKGLVAQGSKIEKNTDELASGNVDVAKVSIKESMEMADRVMMTSLVISGLVLLLGIMIAIVLTNMIRKPVLTLTAVAKEYANGDLRSQIHVHSNDEIGDLAHSLGVMHKNFVEMITNIRSASVHLAGASEAMAASTEEVTATSGEISNNMHNLAKEAEDGNQSMLVASQALVQLSSLIQMAKTKSEHTCEISERTLVAAENGRRQVDQSVNKMGTIKQQAQYSSQIIGELNDYSKQISQITDTITNLAKQTNLLALNAAIEAARAGEHGRGFAVVAEEVRKLAEQSDQGAQEITSLVQMITEKTNVAVSAMAHNVSEVEDGVVSVNEAGLALDRILQAVQQTTVEIKSIGTLTSEEVANSEQIVKIIDHLATMVESVAAHGEEVSSSAEEQSSTMETVAASAEETSAMAQQLKDSVSKFLV